MGKYLVPEIVAHTTGCLKIKVSMEDFNSELLITLLHSFLTSLKVLFDISLIRLEPEGEVMIVFP